MIGGEMISVVIPCYNVAEYIRETAASVLAQSYESIQLILVDDGSKDGTGAILDEIGAADDRVVVLHKPNGGVTSARLTGVEVAGGEWIGFVDGDDRIDADMYKRLIGNAHRYGADISHCGYRMVYPSRVVYYYNTGRLAEQDRITGLKDLLSGSFIEPGLCNKLFHKSLLQSLFHSGAMDTGIRDMEDYLMNYYLFREARKSVYEDFCPYQYVLRLGSACHSAVDEHRLTDSLKVFRIIKADLKDESLTQIINQRIAHKLIGLSGLNCRNQPELTRPIRTRARRELRAMLPEILRGNYSKRTKLFSAWCAVWPWSYRAVHAVYSHIRGTAHAYEVK